MEARHNRTLTYVLKLQCLVFSHAVHPCDKDESPCKNGAVCEAMEDQFVCKCAEGWKGVTCEEKGDLKFENFIVFVTQWLVNYVFHVLDVVIFFP